MVCDTVTDNNDAECRMIVVLCKQETEWVYGQSLAEYRIKMEQDETADHQ